MKDASTIDYEARLRALEEALDELPGYLHNTISISIARVQSLVVMLDTNGNPVLPVPWTKWLCSDAMDFAEYNDTRLDLTGDKLVRPEDMGTLLDPSHPAYKAVRDDYARRGFRLNKSVEIYALEAGATKADVAETGAWSDLVKHLVGAVNALPAAQRAMVTHQLQAR